MGPNRYGEVDEEQVPWDEQELCSNGRRVFYKASGVTRNWEYDPDADPSLRLACFATKRRPWQYYWVGDDDERLEDEDEDESRRVLVRVYVVCLDDCSVYRVATFKSSTEDIACACADSKVFIFEADQPFYFYMDLKKKKTESPWVQANTHLNRKKRHPVSFSLAGKIFVLDTPVDSDYEKYSPEPGEEEEDPYRFEVLDPHHPQPCWTPLSSPPSLFGVASVRGSWTQEEEEKPRIFLDAGSGAFRFILIYDVYKDSWYLVRPSYPQPYCRYAFHLVGSDLAPLLDFYSSARLIAVGDLNFCPPATAASASASGACHRTPAFSPANVLTDNQGSLVLKLGWNKDQKAFHKHNGWQFPGLWTLHCLPSDDLKLWQAFHLGGSRFCILAFYDHSGCCFIHNKLHVRVATLDITDATTPVHAFAGDAAGYDPYLYANFVRNKVYTLGNYATNPLPCTQLFVA